MPTVPWSAAAYRNGALPVHVSPAGTTLITIREKELDSEGWEETRVSMTSVPTAHTETPLLTHTPSVYTHALTDMRTSTYPRIGICTQNSLETNPP